MFRNQMGFTLIDVMVTLVIIAILAIFAIPNFIAMENRKKEGTTRANMRATWVAMEDAGIADDGCYPVNECKIVDRLPTNFRNPWGDQQTFVVVLEPDSVTSIPRGVVRVSVSLDQKSYRIRGGDHANRPLALVLTNDP